MNTDSIRYGTILLCFLLCGTIVSQTIPTCDSSFLTGSYTRCSSVNNTRTLIYYYEVGCNTTNAPPLPQPQEGLPCGKIDLRKNDEKTQNAQ